MRNKNVFSLQKKMGKQKARRKDSGATMGYALKQELGF